MKIFRFADNRHSFIDTVQKLSMNCKFNLKFIDSDYPQIKYISELKDSKNVYRSYPVRSIKLLDEDVDISKLDRVMSKSNKVIKNYINSRNKWLKEALYIKTSKELFEKENRYSKESKSELDFINRFDKLTQRANSLIQILHKDYNGPDEMKEYIENEINYFSKMSEKIDKIKKV